MSTKGIYPQTWDLGFAVQFNAETPWHFTQLCHTGYTGYFRLDMEHTYNCFETNDVAVNLCSSSNRDRRAVLTTEPTPLLCDRRAVLTTESTPLLRDWRAALH